MYTYIRKSADEDTYLKGTCNLNGTVYKGALIPNGTNFRRLDAKPLSCMQNTVFRIGNTRLTTFFR